MADPINLDHNATTPCLPEVIEAMAPWFGHAANPASPHQIGRKARQALDDARERSASRLGAWPDELVFTSGATESNQAALLGLAPVGSPTLLVSKLEHPSVSTPVEMLVARGSKVMPLPVSPQGEFEPDKLENLPEGPLVLIAHLAHHGTGAIQPVAELVQHLAERAPGRCRAHTDATQAVGKIRVNFHKLGVDTLAASAHKFNGPAGIGLLLVRRGKPWAPQTIGGGQELGRRGGTPSVALAVGMARALDLAHEQMEKRQAHCLDLRRAFLNRLWANCSPLEVIGPPEGHGLAHTLLVRFPGVKAGLAVMGFDLEGVATSTGSACASGSQRPLPGLELLVPDEAHRREVVRLSFGHEQTVAELEEAGDRIARVVRKLRGNPP
jgi:cysteine desulfurase